MMVRHVPHKCLDSTLPLPLHRPHPWEVVCNILWLLRLRCCCTLLQQLRWDVLLLRVLLHDGNSTSTTAHTRRDAVFQVMLACMTDEGAITL